DEMVEHHVRDRLNGTEPCVVTTTSSIRCAQAHQSVDLPTSLTTYRCARRGRLQRGGTGPLRRSVTRRRRIPAEGDYPAHASTSSLSGSLPLVSRSRHRRRQVDRDDEDRGVTQVGPRLPGYVERIADEGHPHRMTAHGGGVAGVADHREPARIVS